MTDKEKLNKLKQSRQGYRTNARQLIDKITEQFGKQDTEAPDVTELTLSQGKLTNYNTQLESLNAEIFPLVPQKDFEAKSAGCLELQEDLWHAQSLISLMLTPPAAVPDMSAAASSRSMAGSHHDTLSEYNSANGVSAPSKHLRLPKLELAKFDGNPLEWQEFWDAFDSTIHQESLPAIDKFKYLKRLLEGDAAKMVNGYRLIEANYATVIDALQQRFGNPDVAINAHLEQLLGLTAASNDTPSLQSTYDECERHIRSLVSLGLSEDTFGLIFAPIILSKLPRSIRVELHRQNGSKTWEINKLRELFKGELTARQMGEWSLSDGNRARKPPPNHGASGGANGYKPPQGGKPPNRMTATFMQGGGKAQSKGKGSGSYSSKQQISCVFCSGAHYSDQCTRFSDYHSRKAIATQNKLCFKCLSDKHMVKECKRQAKCYYCEGVSHHSSLCGKRELLRRTQQTDTFSAPATVGHSGQSSHQLGQSSRSVGFHSQGFQSPQSGKSNLNPHAPNFSPTHVSNSAAAADGSSVYLQMAEIQFVGDTVITVRIFFDLGSSCSYITRTLKQRLGLKPYGSSVVSNARFEDASRTVKTYETVVVPIPVRGGSAIPIDAFVTDVISPPLQKLPLSAKDYHILGNIPMADSLRDKPVFVPVDILIGQDFYYDFVGSEQIRLDQGLLLVGSKFGYIPSGRIPSPGRGGGDGTALMVATMLNFTTQGPRVHNPNIERFWRIEDMGISDDPYQKDDDVAVQIFNSTIQKVGDRYEAGLTWKDSEPELPDNFNTSHNRLRLLTKRLVRQPELLGQYDEVIQDQVKAGVIERVPDDQLQSSTGPIHYLPHHAVIKPSSATTKVRVVHDASSKASKDSLSLNECLLLGPVFLSDLCGLILRFRVHPIAFVCDIEKAFFQVSLRPSDRDATRFLWLKNPKAPFGPLNLATFRFTKVPFVIICSPFLLSATVKHHLLRSDSAVAEDIASNIYVDNIISGTDSLPAAQLYYSETQRLFKDISMNVREWFSNSGALISGLPSEHKGLGTTTKVLGLLWGTSSDTLFFPESDVLEKDVRTKRHLVQAVSGIYDPCGFLTPVLVKPKVLIQSTWKQHIKWDDPLPQELLDSWAKLRIELSGYSKIQIPRFIGGLPGQAWGIHCFCDASGKAHAAAVYLRSDCSTPKLLFSKCKLSPIEAISLPRLELMAVCVGVRLVQFVQKHIPLTISSVTLWSDSKCVLHWIKSTRVLSTFVANRIREIKSLDCNFRYVPTVLNPADLPTRGAPAEELKANTLWWHGPDFLTKPESQWPVTDLGSVRQTSPEESDVVINTMVNTTEPEPLIGPYGMDPSRFSSLRRLLATTAYVNRFIRNLKARRQRSATATNSSTRCLQAEEITHAKVLWITHVQQALTTKKTFSNLRRDFYLFQDSTGIWRCNGRLYHADISDTAKCPALLPRSHPFTWLIINEAHRSVHHSGTLHTLGELRSAYWVPQGRPEVQRVIKRCKVCRIWEGGPYKAPPFPPLPSFRVVQSIPFENTGIDYLGPLLVSENGSSKKVWICLFTCAVTRAIHLEVVGDLTTYQFLLALRRFIAEHGRPKLVITDNGKYFRLANDVLKRLWSEICKSPDVHEFLAGQEIQWKFITQHAPWMGGFYERLVGSVKRALKKLLGRGFVDLIKLQTLVVEVSSVLNSRPLLYSTDVKDRVLTPADLLGKRAKRGLPSAVSEDGDDPPVTDGAALAENLVTSWKGFENALNQFWDIWHRDYLTALHERRTANHNNRAAASEPVIVGTPVLISGPGPRALWRVGVVESIVTSADNCVRSAVVKLSSGRTTKRPIKLLYPLEVAAETAIHHSDTQSTETSTQQTNTTHHNAGLTAGDTICSRAVSVPDAGDTAEPSQPATRRSKRSAAKLAFGDIQAQLFDTSDDESE